jgi:hypothetical protein
MTWRERAGGLTRVFRRVMSPLHLQVEGAKGKTGT